MARAGAAGGDTPAPGDDGIGGRGTLGVDPWLAGAGIPIVVGVRGRGAPGRKPGGTPGVVDPSGIVFASGPLATGTGASLGAAGEAPEAALIAGVVLPSGFTTATPDALLAAVTRLRQKSPADCQRFFV